MSDVIEFFERVGQDAQWSQATQDEVQIALAGTDLAPEVQAAIVAGDQLSLQAMMGLAPLSAMFTPGKDDEKEGEEDEELPPGEEKNAPEELTSSAQLSVK